MDNGLETSLDGEIVTAELLKEKTKNHKARCFCRSCTLLKYLVNLENKIKDGD